MCRLRIYCDNCFVSQAYYFVICSYFAKVAKLVYALVLGTSGATRESSSLSFRTIFLLSLLFTPEFKVKPEVRHRNVSRYVASRMSRYCMWFSWLLEKNLKHGLATFIYTDVGKFGSKCAFSPCKLRFLERLMGNRRNYMQRVLRLVSHSIEAFLTTYYYCNWIIFS